MAAFYGLRRVRHEVYREDKNWRRVAPGFHLSQG